MNNDELLTVLNRNLDFIKQADAKAAFLSTLLLFTLGYLVNKSSIFTDSIWSLIVYAMLFIVAGSVSIYIAKAIQPKLKDGISATSHIYFGSIATLSRETYGKELLKLKKSAKHKELIDQVYVTSVITAKKMESINRAFFFLAIFILISALSTVIARYY